MFADPACNTKQIFWLKTKEVKRKLDAIDYSKQILKPLDKKNKLKLKTLKIWEKVF